METQTSESNVSAAPIPGAGAKARKVAKATSGKVAQPVKTAKVKGEKVAKVKEQRSCECGCGEKTGGFFVPGHDAKFKSTLLKIERGELTPENGLKKAVREKYQWKKKGAGMIPTTNYRGEKHSGYDA